jgi:hypothetical protein
MQDCKIWVMRVPWGPKPRMALLAKASNNFPDIDVQTVMQGCGKVMRQINTGHESCEARNQE